MEIKSLKERLLAMKNIALQIQDTCMPKLQTKITILAVEQESQIKSNVELTH